jgi:sorbitol-specific phosphotransferase system component IIA
MDKNTACTLARNFLSEKIALTFHETPPAELALYNFKPDDEFLFSYKLGGVQAIGGTDYIAVSKVSGGVRELGFLGE